MVRRMVWRYLAQQGCEIPFRYGVSKVPGDEADLDGLAIREWCCCQSHRDWSTIRRDGHVLCWPYLPFRCPYHFDIFREMGVSVGLSG